MCNHDSDYRFRGMCSICERNRADRAERKLAMLVDASSLVMKHWDPAARAVLHSTLATVKAAP
jgi:hypothetical protein